MTAPAKKILFVCSHLIGRARATGALAERLVADGHGAVIAAPATAMPYLTHMDIAVHEICAFDLGGARGRKRSTLRDFLPSARDQQQAKLKAQLQLHDFELVLQQEKPDLVVIDFEMHPHVITALGSNAAVVLLSDLFISQPGPGAPPLDSTLVPNGKNGATVRRAWLRLWMTWRKRQLRQWLSTAGTDYLSLLHYIAKTRSVDLRYHTTRWWWQVPIAWRKLPLVILQAPALDFPIDYDPQILHVGPMHPAVQPATARDNAVLNLARDAKSQSKKLVYIGFGASFKANENVIRKVWQVVRDSPDLVAIQTTGGRTDFRGESPPDNLHLVDWAPQRRLLALCDATVMHGGVNTLLECIATHTPMLAVPGGVDQPGNAARIFYHGLGLVCTKTSSLEDIRQGLHAVLNDPSYRKRCEEMDTALTQVETSKTAETVFRALLENKGRAPKQNRAANAG